MHHEDLNGKALWDIQKKFNDKFFETKGGWPTEADLVSANKDFAIHLIKEATEVLDEVSFKMHRKGKGAVDRDNVLEELVDVSKFLFGWMQIWGFTWDDFREEFKRKSMVVDQRFDFEQSLPSLASAPCCIIDIDGVLASYPRGYYEWCIGNFYQHYSLTEFSKLYSEMDLLARDHLKTQYRKSGAKADLPLIPGAKELVDCVLRRSKLKIILMTNRPYAEHYRIYPDTLAWLKKNKISHDGIVWSRDKGVDVLKNFKNVLFAVDDEVGNVKRLREAGITTCHVREEFGGTMALYKLAERVKKIEDLGFAWQDEQQGKEATL